MKYYISKDNARPEVDNFQEIATALELVLTKHKVKVNEHFTLHLKDVKHWYDYCFKNGYILQKVYPHFTYSEYNNNPEDYQGY